MGHSPKWNRPAPYKSDWRKSLGVKIPLAAKSRGPNSNMLAYTDRALSTKGGSRWAPIPFLLVDQVHQIFSAQRRRDGSWSSLFPVVDILIHFAHIHDQNRKLSKLVRTVDFGQVHIGQRNFAVSEQKFTKLFLFNSEGIAVNEVCFRLSISKPFREILAVKFESCTKSQRILDAFCLPKFSGGGAPPKKNNCT